MMINCKLNASLLPPPKQLTLQAARLVCWSHISLESNNLKRKKNELKGVANVVKISRLIALRPSSTTNSYLLVFVCVSSHISLRCIPS